MIRIRHRLFRSARPVAAAATLACAAAGHAQSEPSEPGRSSEPERIIQGGHDVTPNSEPQWIDLRSDVDGRFGFGSVYRIDGGFMRAQGALEAIFTRSLPMSPRLGLSGARIPAGTYYRIGGAPQTRDRPMWRAGMVTGLYAGAAPGLPGTGSVAGAPGATAIMPGATIVPPPYVGGVVAGDARTVSTPGPASGRSVTTGDRSAQAATRPGNASLPERRTSAGAALSDVRVPLPAIVADSAYRSQRLRAMLARAAAGALARKRSSGTTPPGAEPPATAPDQAARGRSGSSSK